MGTEIYKDEQAFDDYAERHKSNFCFEWIQACCHPKENCEIDTIGYMYYSPAGVEETYHTALVCTLCGAVIEEE